ncbi:MAG: geranylgeranyl reductase family protein [Candidatus Hodarchaeota archaeon]
MTGENKEIEDGNDLDHDVIIIGGGPAGSSAAYLLGNQGLDVLLIDKKRFPRPKLCGGLLTKKSLEIVNAIFGETEESLREKGVINCTTAEYEISYKLKKILSRGTSHINFNFVDRGVYDNHFLELAKKAGIKVIEGEGVKKVDLSRNEVITSSGKEYKTRFIIGADGVNSIVRNEFMRQGIIERKPWNDQMASAVETYVDRKELDDEQFRRAKLIFGFIKWGYAWVFPNKDRVVIGLGGLNKKNKGTYFDVMNDFLNALEIKSDSVSKIHAHPIPYGNFKTKPVANESVLLIGDAGGFVDPLWGEGLYLAPRTAQLAVLAINGKIHENKSIEDTYIQSLQEEIYTELKWATYLRWIVFNSFNVALKYVPAKIIIKLFEKQFLEIIHGIRSYKWMRNKNK